MNHTTNYQLSQWAKSDQVKMEDFNADNLKIDGALKAEADARAAAVQAVADTVPKIAAGTYTGDGAATRVIELGFTPKAVYVCPPNGEVYAWHSYHYYRGGLAVTGAPAGPGNAPTVEIVDGGFRVAFDDSTNNKIQSNSNGLVCHYLAIG